MKRFIVALLALVPFGAPALAARLSWTHSRVVGSPEPPAPYRVRPLFPNLTFDRPIQMVAVPGRPWYMLVQQDGRIFALPTDPATRQTNQVNNLRDHHQPFDSIYSIAFHPGFATNRWAFLCYVEPGGRTNGTTVSRFTVSADDPPRLDLASEKIIVQWLSGGHNGCDLQFGPDGLLYVSTGDGSAPDPPDGLRTGQNLDDLLSCILRLDVDHPSPGRNYSIPKDNPFVAIPGARGEIWAYGFRNPWRMSFGPDGALWVGDVGWELWELLHVVREAGYNGGWSFVEGPNPSVRHDVRPGPTPIHKPLVAHPHSEAASITGGMFYRGQRLPSLRGAYIYGDWATGKFWAVRAGGDRLSEKIELCTTTLRPIAFGTTPDGELFILDYNGGIMELAVNDRAHDPARFPRKLSETGLFSDAANQVPAPGVHEYSINAEMWSDHAFSRRWVAVPGSEPVTVTDKFNFPSNSVLAKTLAIETEVGQPSSTRKIETQLLHFDGLSWAAYAYRWNDAQSDAELVGAEGVNFDFTVVDRGAPGGTREQSWRIASRTECLRCHNPWAGNAIAFNYEQLNRSLGGGTRTVLDQFRELGLVSLPTNAPAPLPRLANPYDNRQPIHDRARTWLHVNCSHCHRFGAGGSVATLLSYELDLAGLRSLDVSPIRGGFGLVTPRVIASGAPESSVLLYRISSEGQGHMPLIGARFVDDRGVDLIREWIRDLRPLTNAPVTGTREFLEFARSRDRALSEWKAAKTPEAKVHAAAPLLAGPSGALALLGARGDLPPETMAAVARTARSPGARELLQHFLPSRERRKTLGAQFDYQVVLGLTGDVSRGRVMFEAEAGPQCARCHPVHGVGRSFGPDLGEIGRKYSLPDLLDHIVLPSKTVAPEFVLHQVETKDGLAYSGFVVRESAAELVIRTEDNPALAIPRAQVASDVRSSSSAMPEGLLQALTAQEAADLLAYLKSLAR